MKKLLKLYLKCKKEQLAKMLIEANKMIVYGRVHCCPVCYGSGIVPRGFYESVTGEYVGTDATPEKCKSCNNGVINY